MFNTRELATILGALLFWREEITLNSPDSAQCYLKSAKMEGVEPLTSAEIKTLSRRLRSLLKRDE